MKKFIVLFTAMFMALSPTAAQAHAFNVYQGNDYTHVGPYHEAGSVWDVECDSHSVTAEMYSGGSFSFGVTDPDGCGGNPGRFSIASNVTKIRTCEYYDETGATYCSAWKVID